MFVTKNKPTSFYRSQNVGLRHEKESIKSVLYMAPKYHFSSTFSVHHNFQLDHVVFHPTPYVRIKESIIESVNKC